MKFQSLKVFILFILISGSSWSQDNDHMPTYYHVCYEGVFLKTPSDTAVKEKFNLPKDIKFKFKDLLEPQKGADDNFYRFEDDEGNRYTGMDVEARCYEDKGTMISYENNSNNIVAATIGEDKKLKTGISYVDSYPTALLVPVGYYFIENLGKFYCFKAFRYDFNEDKIGVIDTVIHRKVINNKCAETAITYRDTLSIYDPLTFGSSPEYVINKKNIELHAKYIPVYRSCIKEDIRVDKSAADKLIKKYIEEIKKGIEYELVSREDMNAQDKEGKKLANEIQGNGLYSNFSYQVVANEFRNVYEDGSLWSFVSFEALQKIPNLCARFNKLALDYQIEEIEGPY